MNHWRMRLLFGFLIVSWSIAWPISKIGLQFMSPLWFTSARLLVGTTTMMGFVLATKKFAIPKAQDLGLILAVGLLQISCYILLSSIGLSYLPAGQAALLAYTTPLWVMPIATLIFREDTGLLKWAGFFLGMGGLFLLLCPWQLNWHDRHIIYGSLFLLLASFSWGISIICIRYMHWHKSPLELIPWQLLIGTIPVLLFTTFKEPFPMVTWNGSLILSLLYTGVLITGISYWGGVVVNKRLPAIMVSLGFLAVPVFSLLLSVTFLHETISLLMMLSMLSILLGVTCVAL
mgnify:CR=1 FL=1